MKTEDVLDCIVWCRAKAATISWRCTADGLLARVEVQAPDASWNLLRGEALDLVVAYRQVRQAYEERLLVPLKARRRVVG